MNETEPASDDIEESTMDEGETYDIPHDEEISESLSETDDGSEISDLMDIEETPEITEEESLEAGADLPNDEVLVEDVGDNVPENEEIEQTDLDVNRGPDDFETSPETLEIHLNMKLSENLLQVNPEIQKRGICQMFLLLKST